MMRRTTVSRTGVVLLSLFVAAGTLLMAAGDGSWPQYRGPKQDGISSESGLLKSWPESGPRVLWKAALGDGYSGISVAGGKVYTMFSDADGEYLACFGAADGKELWRVRLDDNRSDRFGDGPRSTPTVDGDVVYALGAQGVLVAVTTADGKTRWQKDLKQEVSATVPQWGVSASPLVEGNLLLVTAGGKPDAAVVALDTKTGELRWKAHSDKPGYSTPLPVEMHGVRQVLFFTGSSLASVKPDDGTVLWSVPWKTSYSVNAAMPIQVAPDKVFVSSGYDTGAAVFQVSRSGDTWTAKETWKSRVMKNHFNSSILHEGYLYGFDDATLKCVNALSGEESWGQRGFAKGSLLLADGHLLVFSEEGLLALVEATPDGYKEKARAQIFESRTWTMPSLAGGTLYLRSQKEMVALDITG
jgi:outer membrane protein assembly factor BamB